VRRRRLTFPSHDELEGYWPLAGRQALFAVARSRDNLFTGAIRETKPRRSLPESSPSGAESRPASGRP
jgi:hypothetical protein